MATYTYPQSEVLLLVPMQYRAGGIVTAGYELYDGNRDTTYTTTGTISNLTISGLNGKCTCSYCLLDNVSTYYTSGGWQFKINGSSKTPLSPYLYEVSGYTGQYSRATTNIRRYTVSSYGELPVLVRLTPATFVTDCTLYCNAISGGSPTVRGVIFSESFNLPMYDVGWSGSIDFPQMDSRTKTGVLGHDMSTAKSVQAQESYSFHWSALTSAQVDVVDDFVDAFGGNVQQPFALVVLKGDDTMLEPLHLLIDSSTVSISESDNGSYSFGFSAKRLNVTY